MGGGGGGGGGAGIFFGNWRVWCYCHASASKETVVTVTGGCSGVGVINKSSEESSKEQLYRGETALCATFLSLSSFSVSLKLQFLWSLRHQVSPTSISNQCRYFLTP